jgi:rhodanese-related sulfurtransferase
MFIQFRNKTSKTYGQQFLQSAWQCAAMFILAVFLGFSTNQIRDSRLTLFEDWSLKANPVSRSGERLDISLAKAKKVFLEKTAVFIDARPKDDFEKGHIKGALSLPWYEVDQTFVDVTKEISVNTPIITYCDGETCELSHNLANFFLDMGFADVKILVNGWTRWQKADLPIEKEDSN